MINKLAIILTDEEARALYEYFMGRAGYISYEFDLPIIEFIRKLEVYLSEEKEKT